MIYKIYMLAGSSRDHIFNTNMRELKAHKAAFLGKIIH